MLQLRTRQLRRRLRISGGQLRIGYWIEDTEDKYLSSTALEKKGNLKGT